jgi:hypothetical protein
MVPEQKELLLELPDSYLHQPVEVLVFPVCQAEAGVLVSEPERRIDLSVLVQYNFAITN